MVEAEAELSDDPFDSSDEEDEQNDDVLRVLSRQSNTAVVIKPASRQTLLNWIASAWKKLNVRPALVCKSFEVTGITVSKDKESVRSEVFQREIAAGFDDCAGSDSDMDGESVSEEESEEDDLHYVSNDSAN